MKMPLIGLTASHSAKAEGLALRSNYADSIRAAGGIPVILPLELSDEEAEQLADTLDGVLFTGGPDIHPFLFGEETLKGCGDASALRDNLEPAFFKRMYYRKKPILGICRGAQLINITLGGTIYQDIPSLFHEGLPIAHIQPFHYKSPSHKVTVLSGTKLAQLSGSNSIEVNSMHHQAVKDLAPALVVSGYASGNLIEALEMPDYPYLVGVQWHPEYLYESYAHAKNLFDSFVGACRT